MGWKWIIGLMHDTDELKIHRKILYQKYRTDAAMAFRPVQLCKIHELLRNLLADSGNFQSHLE